MKNFFKIIRKDSVLLWSFWLSLLAIVLSIACISLAYVNLPPVLPLYNQMPWGYARLGNTYELFILPLLSLGILLVNSIVGIQLHGKVPLLARFLFLTFMTLTFFSLIFIIRLILLTL